MLDSASSVTQDRLTKEAYTVTETARLFEPPVNPVTIYRQIYAGNIKVLEGFGRIRIPRSELQRLDPKFAGRAVYQETCLLRMRGRSIARSGLVSGGFLLGHQ